MYKLTVTAYDCGKNRASEDVLVKISVKPTCKPSWQGIKALLHTVTCQPSLVRCVFVEQKQSTNAESKQATIIKKIIWLL